MEPLYESHLRVNACDTDSTGRLRVSSMFNYIQNMASVHAEGLGVGIQKMLNLNMFWVLSWVKLEFICMPRFGDELSAKTWPKCRHRLFSIRDFLFYDKNGALFSKGTTAWLLVDLKTKKAKNPECLEARIPCLESMGALHCYPERFHSEHPGQPVFTRRIRYSDLDINRHVNNARYVEFLMDCYDVEHHRRHRVGSLAVSFVAEARCGDEIDVRLAENSDNGSSHFIEVRNMQSDEPVVQSVIHWIPLRQTESG